jgi:hypothetical protein
MKPAGAADHQADAEFAPLIIEEQQESAHENERERTPHGGER